MGEFGTGETREMKLKPSPSAMLTGLQVLDLADEKAGFCAKLLADMGARVIKVEKPGGDTDRRKGPFLENRSPCQKSLPFSYNNSNKLGITLDVEHEEGKSLFLELIKKADVLVETFIPGHLRDIGLDYENLTKLNPKLIHVSVTGFGRSGPRANYKACDLIASASGGQMSVSGSPKKSPLKAFGNQSHYSASLFAATAVMLALNQRGKTGKGDHIDVSLQASVTSTLEHVMTSYFGEKTIQRRLGGLHWNGEFVVLPCKDGFVHATLLQQWETLIGWLDAEGMAEDLKEKKWLDDDYRREHIQHVIEVMTRWTTTHTRSEIFELAQLMRFPWAPVQSPDEVIRCPQLSSREFFVETTDQCGNTLKCPGSPYRIRGDHSVTNRPAPLPGEHNELIFRQELGISEDNLKRLYSLSVI